MTFFTENLINTKINMSLIVKISRETWSNATTPAFQWLKQEIQPKTTANLPPVVPQVGSLNTKL